MLIIISVLVSLSTILLVIYFVSSVLYINKRVNNEIYIYTLSGLYSSKVTEVDPSSINVLLDLNPGSQTDKTVVSDIYIYFNEDSFSVLESFEAVFGPKSFLYKYRDHSKKIIYFWDKHFENKDLPKSELKPYHYRNIDNNLDITHEFFQMYRYTKLQTIWAKKVYYLTKQGDYNIITYSNIIRILKNSVNYLNDELVKSYDFINFITIEYINNTNDSLKDYLKSDNKSLELEKIETFFLENYFELINTSLIHLIFLNKYEEANKVILELKRIIETKTIIEDKDKLTLLDSWFSKAKSLKKNFDEEIIASILKVLNSK